MPGTICPIKKELPVEETPKPELTWGMAGLSVVCKTFRQGFDSLPRLQNTFYRWWNGIDTYRFALYKNGERFPTDYTKRKLRDLVLHHCEESIKAKTEAYNLRERLIAAQKELSDLKRNKKK